MQTDKILFVGDVHATVDDLPDCERLIDLVIEVVNKESPNVVVFLGDQHHNHAVVRVEIIAFWQKVWNRIENEPKRSSYLPTVVCLVGNHDKPGDISNPDHAMLSYLSQVKVVDSPEIHHNILFVPYIHDGNDFVKICNDYKDIKTVICHQMFNGGKYDNGFYAKDGVLPESIPQNHVIAGHIHTPQEFGKVWYPGSPRWRTLSDANIGRDIWVVEFEDGIPVKRAPYSTKGYCRELIEVNDTENTDVCVPGAGKIKQPYSLIVNISGSRQYVNSQKEYWQKEDARIGRVNIVDDKVSVKAKESEGIAVALKKFVSSFNPKFGTSFELLEKMVAERIHV